MSVSALSLPAVFSTIGSPKFKGTCNHPSITHSPVNISDTIYKSVLKPSVRFVFAKPSLTK